MKRKAVLILALALWLAAGSIAAVAQEEVVCQTEVVVQVNDWLAKIAAKFYGNTHAYPLIVSATNAKAAADSSFAVIRNPNLIRPGWKLCLPAAESFAAPAAAAPTTRYFIGLKTATDAPSSQATLIETQRYPLHAAPRFFAESAGGLLIAVEPPPGNVRLALARPVANPDEPEALNMTSPAAWVLLVPAGQNQNVLAWQEILENAPPNAPTDTLVVERAITQVTPFDNNTSTPQASLASMFAALSDDLWVDFILFEAAGPGGTSQWTLYAFALPPGTPAGEDRATTFCCRWLGCGQATGLAAKNCSFWGCAGVCQ
ncbi:MAG: LysM peptidoglycan-binding domain-containing protein [Anaerolineae bacterium]